MGKKASLRQQRKAAKARQEEKEEQTPEGQAPQEVKHPMRVYSGPEVKVEGTEIEREL